MSDVRLLTLDPGHFHAALVQKEMAAGVSPRVHVYGELGPDLLAHLGRLASFNGRATDPTCWEVEVHAGPDPLGRLLREQPGNVVVIAGRNAGKIGKILACVRAGLHVLADKPWVIEPEDLPTLREALDTARARNVVAHDVMTERHEITTILQRGLVNDPDVFGEVLQGTPDEPGVFMESVHYLLKTVAGAPLRRPVWFFDVAQQGEALTDVGTHLVDLVPWVLFPGRPVEGAETSILAAERWPTRIGLDDFRQVTGEGFPPWLAARLDGDRLACYCNNRVLYTIRGVAVRLDVRWECKAEVGGDTHFASFRGSRARVEVRQGRAEHHRPELSVIPAEGDVIAALRSRIALWQATYPGVGLEERGTEWRVTIPDCYRIGHEAHFGQVTREFLGYLRDPQTLPAWEAPNMRTKYHVTTEGVRLARQPSGDLIK